MSDCTVQSWTKNMVKMRLPLLTARSKRVDFIIQRENDSIPVEVKSEANTEAKCLKRYKEKFREQVKIRICFSLDNPKLDIDVLNIPLFMADKADHLIGLALTQLSC